MMSSEALDRVEIVEATLDDHQPRDTAAHQCRCGGFSTNHASLTIDAEWRRHRAVQIVEALGPKCTICGEPLTSAAGGQACPPCSRLLMGRG